MSDSLTRLILRAQGRLPAEVVTAAPLLASRHENDAGPASAEAQPRIAYGVEVEADSVDRPVGMSPHRAAHDAGSPPEGLIRRERMSNDPGEHAGNASRPVPPVATPPITIPSSASMHGTNGRDRIAEGAERTRTDNLARFTTPDRSPMGRGEKSDTLSSHQAPSAPRADGETIDPPVSSPTIAQIDTAQRSAAEPVRYQFAPPRAVGSPPVKPVFTPSVRTQPEPIAARLRDEPPATPDVSITIGLVEVHAVLPRASPPRPTAARRPGTSLADYLAQRSGRSS
jgi:hypothetical protein